MGRFDGILMCTDLDGTLMRKDKSVSRENIEAIEYFKAEGGAFTFITGRMPYASVPVDVVKPNIPFGCVNGGAIYDPIEKKYVWKFPISKEALELVMYISEKMEDMAFQINTFERIYFIRDNPAMEHFREVSKVPYITAKPEEIKDELAKILFAHLDEERIQTLAALLKAHSKAEQFDFVRSEKTLYEILPKGSSKGLALCKMCEIFGYDINKTIALGDYTNDVEMLKMAGCGIAVANACPDAKEAADYVSVSNEEHIVAKTVEDIESGKIRF